ncbi:MAG: hypothetical protein LBC67_01575 [Spirochaetales bacterium]|jgi:hypothetical protein|nr:hypothetical protein [Spirochaetales bacterium]
MQTDVIGSSGEIVNPVSPPPPPPESQPAPLSEPAQEPQQIYQPDYMGTRVDTSA